ncbi:MAG TPA: hypothetical protein VK304_04005 [Thermoleophilaceae bacterium]|nr:hypothetical protein [Thermoleophilaceae bacterium]
MNKFLVGSVLGAFTVVVITMGVLIAIDTEHAQLYLGVIGLLAVLSTVLAFGVLLHITKPGEDDRDRRETYARVMIALVTATAGTVGGVGGGAVVSSTQTDAAKQDAAAANAKATDAQQQVDQVEKAQPQDERPAGK